MSKGGITIEDNALVAANVQLISNNHDVKEKQIITCKPIHLKKNVGLVRMQQYCPA